MTSIDRSDIRPSVEPERYLLDVPYLAHPFRLRDGAPAVSNRAAHVREQIEQLLFTAPGERVHRPDFGVGVEMLVFEPGGDQLKAVIQQRLTSALAEVLAGEVDPESITTSVEMRDEATVVIQVGYRLATIDRSFEHEFTVRS